MTNRQRARAWLLDTFPSAWEAEHVASLAALLDEVAIAATVRASGGGTGCSGEDVRRRRDHARVACTCSQAVLSRIDRQALSLYVQSTYSLTMKNVSYSKFNLVVRYGSAVKFFRALVAVSLDAAFADVTAAYGEGELVQWGTA